MKNNNFFSVTVTDIQMNLIFMKQSIAKQSTTNINVGLRSEIKVIMYSHTIKYIHFTRGSEQVVCECRNQNDTFLPFFHIIS